MKNKKGITLIALIITIIVMLILVAVTINVALNGGLFGKAKDAKVKTQKEVEREQLLEAVVSAYNNQGSFVIGDVDMPDDMEWVESKETAYTGSSAITPSNDGGWIATKNGNHFYIDSYGNILDEEPEKEIESNLYTLKAPTVSEFNALLTLAGDEALSGYETGEAPIYNFIISINSESDSDLIFRCAGDNIWSLNDKVYDYDETTETVKALIYYNSDINDEKEGVNLIGGNWYIVSMDENEDFTYTLIDGTNVKFPTFNKSDVRCSGAQYFINDETKQEEFNNAVINTFFE